MTKTKTKTTAELRALAAEIRTLTPEQMAARICSGLERRACVDPDAAELLFLLDGPHARTRRAD